MRLVSCDLRHPRQPAELRDYMHKRGRKITVCLACQRIYQLAKYHGKPLPVPVEKIHTPYRPDYGVLPQLNWAPPQL